MDTENKSAEPPKEFCSCGSCDCAICQRQDDHELVKPSLCQLSIMSWAVLWRYFVVAAAIFAISIPFYMMHADFMVDLSQKVGTLGNVVLTSGYMAAFLAYPGWIALWFLARIVLGYFITYWIFTQILYKNFGGFSLQMRNAVGCTNEGMKGGTWGSLALHKITGAFYVRVVILMLLYFVFLLLIVPPVSLIENYMNICLISLIVLHFVMILVFARLFNTICGHPGVCRACLFVAGPKKSEGFDD